MTQSVERRTLTVVAADGARARLQLHLPAQAQSALYWIPALGVGIGPNEVLADALAGVGVAVAIHEWRGLGDSNRRASRHCDWGYRELLELDIAAGLDAVQQELPGRRCQLGGHSLGGQFALIAAAQREVRSDDSVLLVASGQPHWKAFPGVRAAGVLAFAGAIPAITAAVGYFPGTRLGFAGREASGVMRDWSGTAIRGDYRVRGYGTKIQQSLAAYGGRVLAIRMRDDRLAPPGAIKRLRALTPRANWLVLEFGRDQFATRRPDHFGWLREPASVVLAFDAWHRGV